jgi:predicted nicotinamide N-methyase
LVSGLYEGGLKVWECSFDLVDYVFANKELVAGKRVLELGCGQSLPGIACALLDAAKVCLHDYNAEVIQFATMPTVKLNLQKWDKSDLLARFSFHSGSWADFKVAETQKRFDIILMAETLYNKDYYTQLFELVKHCLAPGAVCIIGSKSFYFGLGGGLYELQQFLKARTDLELGLTVEKKLNDMVSIERVICHV